MNDASSLDGSIQLMNLIGNIDRLLFVDNSIVVVDRHIAKAVYVFDMNGRFERQISHIGNGPKEYLAINCIFITSDNKIAIVDNMKGRTMFFDKNGRYLKSEKNDIRGSEVDSYFSISDPKYGELKLIYDHRTHECTSVSNDSYDPLLSFFTSPKERYSDNTLVESVPLNRIMFFKDMFLKEFPNNESVKKLYSNLEPDSNPVLFFYNVPL